MNATNIQNIVRDSYIVVVIAILGIFAFISALLISWPALAYLVAPFVML